jgi:hypothetical protein
LRYLLLSDFIGPHRLSGNDCLVQDFNRSVPETLHVFVGESL